MAPLESNSEATSRILLLFQGFVAPAIFVSASALLLLSINTRLMGMVTRLRQYLHEKYAAVKEGRLSEAEAYGAQIASIEQRAEMIRKAFVLTLISLTGTIVSCLLLGIGIYVEDAALVAAASFIISILALLCGAIYYLREVSMALTSVRDETADTSFMETTYTAADHHSPESGEIRPSTPHFS